MRANRKPRKTTATRDGIFVQCRSWSTAKRRCPWAAMIAKVEGGYRCFESSSDYTAWRIREREAQP